MTAVVTLIAVLAGTTPASAHVEADPPFLPADAATSIDFIGPNERSDPMDSFSLTVPPGLRIEHAHEVEGWRESLDGRTATWTGGLLSPDDVRGFGATIAAGSNPGSVEAIAEQRFADGGVVRWPVRMTVTPPQESESQRPAVVGVLALVGLLVLGALAVLARRRRGSATR